MDRCLSKLASIAGPPLGEAALNLSDYLGESPQDVELARLLGKRNGFFALESALHVFPVGSEVVGVSLGDWNAKELWRSMYEGITDGLTFFAEDVFGHQFAIGSGGVYRFDPETGERERIATDLEEWASIILGDYKVETGYPLAHEWQLRNGPLPAGKRLVPKLPFVLGGEFSVDNLHAQDAVEAMRYRASIATQLRGLPDGATVRCLMILKRHLLRGLAG